MEISLGGRWDSRELSHRKWKENGSELLFTRACPFSSKAPDFLQEFLASELKNTRKHQIVIDCAMLSLVTSAATF